MVMPPVVPPGLKAVLKDHRKRAQSSRASSHATQAHGIPVNSMPITATLAMMAREYWGVFEDLMKDDQQPRKIKRGSLKKNSKPRYATMSIFVISAELHTVLLTAMSHRFSVLNSGYWPVELYQAFIDLGEQGEIKGKVGKAWEYTCRALKERRAGRGPNSDKQGHEGMIAADVKEAQRRWKVSAMAQEILARDAMLECPQAPKKKSVKKSSSEGSGKTKEKRPKQENSARIQKSKK
ncbi:hypothetical protein LTR56_006869 [Elasticomyces elasticus]|nr:hypothetical protein LTR22_016702 [Elasticomyces elasticus]KAK3649393.1 hypothetical protein LTR56_006869 [Elasticomyces elasticus]